MMTDESRTITLLFTGRLVELQRFPISIYNWIIELENLQNSKKISKIGRWRDRKEKYFLISAKIHLFQKYFDATMMQSKKSIFVFVFTSNRWRGGDEMQYFRRIRRNTRVYVFSVINMQVTTVSSLSNFTFTFVSMER